MRRFIRWKHSSSPSPLGSPGTGNSAGKADYPTRAVNIVVPFPPGQSPDLIARALSEGAKGAFPQPFVVLNRPGGAGTIGIAEVVMAKPTGTPWGCADLAADRAATDHVRPPYKRPDDYRPVMKIGSVPWSSPCSWIPRWKSIKDVIDYAKANPGKMRVGSMDWARFRTWTWNSSRKRPASTSRTSRSRGRPPTSPRCWAGTSGDLGFAATGVGSGARGEDPRARHLRGETQPHSAGRADLQGARVRRHVRGVPLGIRPQGTPDWGQGPRRRVQEIHGHGAVRKFVESSNYVVDYQDGAVLKKQLDADYDRMGPIITKLGLKN